MKESICFILDPLVHLINVCFITGVFPDSLKLSKVIPILKKGDPNLPDNYRPISIIPIIGKIIEIIIKHRLLAFLNKHCIINEKQFGLKKKLYNSRPTEAC